jgi:DNA-binding NtrC family response regulator
MSQGPVLLVVDDEPGTLDVLSRFAGRAGFEVVTCATGSEAISLLRTQRMDLALVDLRMPDIDGLDALRAIRESDPRCQAVLMGGYASADTAVEAVKLGAVDYLSKPLEIDRVEQLLAGVRDEIERRRSLQAAESDLAKRLEFCGMIGRSAVMQELFELVRRLAAHVRMAVITGEAGTGKELIARALHRTGPRRDRRFVTLDCSAVVETPLFEGELLGHAPGAFTGATDHKPGLFELADGGTLFLDEVDRLPLTMQARLLHVIELGEVHRLGALEPRRVDVHVLAATNRDLRTEVAAGRFRSDLHYRLSIVELKIPPLRERREDIPYLIAAFTRQCAERLAKPVVGISAPAERLLVSAAWEGNVRELHDVIARACRLADGELVTERELEGCPISMSAPPRGVPEHAGASVAAGAVGGHADLLSTVERDHIQRALIRAGGNKKAAARMLGLSRRALYRRLERLDLAQTISRRKDSARATAGVGRA